MNWQHRHRLRHWYVNSIWIQPVLAMLVAYTLAPVLSRIERQAGWDSGFNPETAKAVLSTLASSLFTFIVFVCSALLVAVQLASAQLTPRIIAIVFRDPVTRFALTTFLFTFTLAITVLTRIDDRVPALSARLVGLASVASLGVFLYLIDHVGKALRPSGALRATGRLGRQVIEQVYPRPLADAAATCDGLPPPIQGPPQVTVTNPKDGVVLAFDVDGLAALALEHDCVIELVPQVGDFVAVGDPLFRVYGGGQAITARALRQSVALGQERTMEQDPALAFRLMADIASKALSPAINDPTTAVLAIDQIHHLLRSVGHRHLDDDRVRDGSGRLRLIYRTPAWDDFVELAVTEIRHYGGESIQIVRRLRAMLENLIQSLPPQRVPRLRQELALLQRSVDRGFAEPEDRQLAAISDSQGVGSHSVPRGDEAPATTT